jgi:hypothetical protein
MGGEGDRLLAIAASEADKRANATASGEAAKEARRQAMLWESATDLTIGSSEWRGDSELLLTVAACTESVFDS